MSLRKRMSTLIVVDSVIVLFSIYIGYFFLYPIDNPFASSYLFVSSLSIFVAHHAFAFYYGLYKKVWEYASIRELVSIALAVTFSILVVAAAQLVFTGNVMLRALMITWMLHILLIGGSRLSWRVIRDTFIQSSKRLNKKRTLIVGAGSAGMMVARQLLKNHDTPLYPVAFVDDDKNKAGLEILGLSVLYDTKQIKEHVANNEIEQIIIAVPSADKSTLTVLKQLSVDTGVKVQAMPLIEDLLTGKVSVSDIKDVKIEDLLGREEVQLDLNAISEKLTDKTILVTGAGGSIGSEICRQVMRFNPKQLLLLGHGENSIYLIDMELREKVPQGTEIIPVIADVQDRERIFAIMEEYKPDVIYHAAAHKHVPLMEANPLEAVKNNIYGTKNVAEAADTFGIGYFVLVSTDKAVNPPNVMGATKRFAEMIVQNLAKTSKTKFAAVRFGNVLGSRGSVVPLFKKQIAAGGPITVTDPEMTRYFMTIPEASRLVIQAGTLAKGGEVFVLDMGEPVKIVDLAKNVIQLSGYSVEEIGIKFSGIRPGEKMYEELLDPAEIQEGFIFPKIHIGRATPIVASELNYVLEKLPTMDEGQVKAVLVGLANRKNVGSLMERKKKEVMAN
ncbi:FlaA1/EpsC-like NDP-sugar epimerase [Chryseomicrobium aureum]|uniref:nucleoside-diphosphate sugar epimerase/dehydratase n=1 Tax=Chryseomicrobium aureum TaxID=1441723 RepID=UPI00195A51D6|nr:nucleoside-diphosphate sugar epimerase/dehydratase [Chryseomicrobium aureum]MBM7706092.1 FlaA1/EpsC-like NDP-sugar epimerase [Chryseomicrobium aureum]